MPPRVTQLNHSTESLLDLDPAHGVVCPLVSQIQLRINPMVWPEAYRPADSRESLLCVCAKTLKSVTQDPGVLKYGEDSPRVHLPWPH